MNLLKFYARCDGEKRSVLTKVYGKVRGGCFVRKGEGRPSCLLGLRAGRTFEIPTICHLRLFTFTEFIPWFPFLVCAAPAVCQRLTPDAGRRNQIHHSVR